MHVIQLTVYDVLAGKIILVLMCGRKFGVMSFGSSVFGAQVREVGGVAPKKWTITSRIATGIDIE